MRVKTQEKREEIMAIAQEVFRERGYAETSMAEISTRLGGSKGTLYSYFDSKEELFLAVMLEIARSTAVGLLDELERAQDMRLALEPFMYRIMTMLCSPEIVAFRRMLIGEAGRSQLGKLAFEQGPKLYLQRFADLFAAQMREGRFREVDPWQASVHMESLCTGSPVQLLLEGVIECTSDAEIAAAARAAADVFLRAYAIEPGSTAETAVRQRPGIPKGKRRRRPG